MKHFFAKKKPQVSIPPCSSDQVGCYYHVELFGKPCPGCQHLPVESKKEQKTEQPKSSPLDYFLKA